MESTNPAPGDTSAFSTAVVLVSPFVVTNTNDSGIGSLRFAIQSANGDINNDDTITFRIPTQDPGFTPSTGSWTIPVLSLLAIAKPTSDGIQHVVVIDGLTQQSQPGAATTHPVVEITPGPRYTGNGLEVTSGGNTVRGLVIGGFQGAGMLVDGSGATGNLVTGNFIGTDVTGTTRLPNRFAGVRLGGSSNTVSSNLISGNTSEGVFVIGGGDQVLDNRIGTNAAGTTALGNGLSGITIQQAANVLVRGNTISGNGSRAGPGQRDHAHGIGGDCQPDRGEFHRHRRRRDRGACPMSADGIAVLPALPATRSAGRMPAARNVISGNGGNGLTISGSSGNSVIGNDIGVGADGTTVLGKRLDGVFLSDAPSNVISRERDLGQRRRRGRRGDQHHRGGLDRQCHEGQPDRDRRRGDGRPRELAARDLHRQRCEQQHRRAGECHLGQRHAANQGVGVYIFGTSTTGNLVLGNLIGTNADGTARLPGSVVGVLISQSPGNTVQQNVISGNGVVGLEIAGGTASGNQVQGNRIGTNAAGTAAIPNGLDGIFINDAPNNVIGGTTAGAGNLISGNLSVGIQLFGAQAVGNVIQGNALGLDSAGRPTLLNRAGGIFVNTGPANNEIGGTAPGQANLGQVRPRYSLSGFHQGTTRVRRRHPRHTSCERLTPGSVTRTAVTRVTHRPMTGWRQGDIPAGPASEGDIEHHRELPAEGQGAGDGPDIGQGEDGPVRDADVQAEGQVDHVRASRRCTAAGNPPS